MIHFHPRQTKSKSDSSDMNAHTEFHVAKARYEQERRIGLWAKLNMIGVILLIMLALGIKLLEL